eukprot:gnl/MRDRNA2_/MRDRNA2_43626_c0_seq1.p1 gnl/MRDRNA2_/MRDRNA2_43626_c0~~gnl/MRDRNA2_/MRDRNA2_43626_c0_seq1.p1  ORF type:complete len:375 (-),score=78.28 gnl/MRDRNA2_/MRDRNA2_43626_c0_seq1:41-1165(-)
MRFLIVPLLTTASTAGASDAFERWAVQYGKVYHSEAAKQQALKTYMTNEEVINRLNQDKEDGAEYGHNEFSDLSPKDFWNRVGTFPLTPAKGHEGGIPAVISEETIRTTPESFDWRTKGAITPVKDQSSCGSCWAESAVQNVESVWYLAQKKRGMMHDTEGPIALSTEQVIECDNYDYACYGGYPSHAMRYIKEAGGLAADSVYPYDMNGHTICLANQTFNQTCGDGMCDDPPLTSYCDLKCSDLKKPKVAKIQGFQSIPTDETAIAAYLAAEAPISVGLDASGKFGVLLPWLQFYKSGVANPKFCRNDTIDHAVLLTGFGTDSGQAYWSIKNSWGAKWGENGYFRLLRGVGKCGINTMAVSAIAADDDEVLVV